MKRKTKGQSKSNINMSYFKTSGRVLYAKEELDLLFIPLSLPHPFQDNAKPPVSGCTCLMAYVNIEGAFRWLK